MQRARPGSRRTQKDKRCSERNPCRTTHDNENRPCRGGMEREDRGGQNPGTGKLEARAAQGRANTSVALVPPKPNELESATRIGILRAAFGT